MASLGEPVIKVFGNVGEGPKRRPVPKKKGTPVTPEAKVFGSSERKPTRPTHAEKEKKSQTEKVKKVDSRVDILTIDSVIKSNFEKDIGTIESLLDDVATYVLIQARSPFDSDKRNAQKEEEILRRRIQGIQTGAGLSLYLFRTDTLIQKYKSVLPKTRVALASEEEKSEELNQVVLDYLRIAKEYIKLENFKGLYSSGEECPECGSTVFHKTEEHGITVCECGVAIDVLNVAPSYNDSKRVNCSTRFKHNAKVYLEDAIDCFECKQGEISEATIKVVLEQMELHGLTSKTVKKDDIYRFLTVKKLSDSYKDINAIYCFVTGEAPPDLSQYRAELLEMSSQFEPVCKKVVTKRTNALTVLWKLYMFLSLLDYPCSREDFYCLKTTSKQEEHQQSWDKIIENLIELYPNEKTSNGKPRWRHLVHDDYVGYQQPMPKNPKKSKTRK